jgi:hypothetical protein
MWSLSGTITLDREWNIIGNHFVILYEKNVCNLLFIAKCSVLKITSKYKTIASDD